MLVSSITLGLSLAIGEWIKQAINVHFSARTKVSMVSDYLVRLFKLPLSFFESRIMGDLLQRTYDFDRIESMIMGAGFNALLGVMSLLVFGSILFIYDSTLFWIYLAASMLYVIWVLFFGPSARKWISDISAILHRITAIGSNFCRKFPTSKITITDNIKDGNGRKSKLDCIKPESN